jgi:PD-(D/E)XK nuclease superfamily
MEDIESQLKELILDEDFTNLQSLASDEVNLMQILGVEKREIQHSNFLAWLFSPNESHNLGDFAVKEFIKLYYRENDFSDLGLKTKLTVFDFIHLDFDDLEIRREYKNIDLILLSRKNEFCIVIENKIHSREGSGQLKKYRELIEKEYPDFKYKIYIFLSLFEQNITEEEQDYYIQLDYTHIVKLLDQIIQRKSLKDKSRFVFEQYLQTLKSMLNQNEEIEEIAQKLYRKYKLAFDLVFQYAEPSQSGLRGSNNLLELVKNHSNLKLKYANKGWIVFYPTFLSELLPKFKEKEFVPSDFELGDDFEFLFQFAIGKESINFAVSIGKGNKKVRENLYGLYSKNNHLFDRVVKKDGKLSREWHQAYQKKLISKSEFEKSLEDENFDLNGLIEKRFLEIVNKDLLKFEHFFRTEFSLDEQKGIKT